MLGRKWLFQLAKHLSFNVFIGFCSSHPGDSYWWLFLSSNISRLKIAERNIVRPPAVWKFHPFMSKCQLAKPLSSSWWHVPITHRISESAFHPKFICASEGNQGSTFTFIFFVRVRIFICILDENWQNHTHQGAHCFLCTFAVLHLRTFYF